MEAIKKKKRAKSPTARALEELRKLGYPAQVVERWNQFAKVRQDLFRCIDIVYLTEGSIVGVQATVGGSHANRRAKILAEPLALAWLKAGGLLEVWSYSLTGARGEVKRWTLRKEELVEADFA
jgi:hypothetical protein